MSSGAHHSPTPALTLPAFLERLFLPAFPSLAPRVLCFPSERPELLAQWWGGYGGVEGAGQPSGVEPRDLAKLFGAKLPPGSDSNSHQEMAEHGVGRRWTESALGRSILGGGGGGAGMASSFPEPGCQGQKKGAEGRRGAEEKDQVFGGAVAMAVSD